MCICFLVGGGDGGLFLLIRFCNFVCCSFGCLGMVGGCSEGDSGFEGVSKEIELEFWLVLSLLVDFVAVCSSFDEDMEEKLED